MQGVYRLFCLLLKAFIQHSMSFGMAKFYQMILMIFMVTTIARSAMA